MERTEAQAHLRFDVVDSGPGIPPEDQHKLFLPFSQLQDRSRGGTGLGLSIVKLLTEGMGGSVSVDSQPGKGACFSVLLPLPVAFLEPEEPPGAAEPGDGELHLLVAEDNAINRRVLVRQLEKRGFHVDAVADGDQALIAARERRYDAILMDCRMPILDGYEATRRIRGDDSPNTETLVIALTASLTAGVPERCREAGMDECLAKPVDFPYLLSLLRRRLSSGE